MKRMSDRTKGGKVLIRTFSFVVRFVLVSLFIVSSGRVSSLSDTIGPSGNTMLSLNFSPYYRDGADPEKASPVSEDEMCALLDAILPYTHTVRTFGVTGELNKFYKFAKEEYNMRIIAGCWIGGGYTEEQALFELRALADIANQGYADVLLVGSEGLFRHDYSAEQLIGWMADLRGMLDNPLPVGTSDTAGTLLGEKELIIVSDVICYTYYPYWNGIPIESAAEDFAGIYERMREAADGKTLICTETGFPDAGDTVGGAVPSPENAARYFKEIYDFSCLNDFEVCYFEAVTEPWKEKYGLAERSFGLLDVNLQPKPAYQAELYKITESNKN